MRRIERMNLIRLIRSIRIRELRGWFERGIAARFPRAEVLYWT